MNTLTKIDSLPFVQSRDIWVPERTRIWSQDNQTGRSYADALVDYMREFDAPCVLGYVIQAIANKGVFEGVEAGFMQRLSELAMRA